MKIFRGSDIFMFSVSYIIFFLGIILPCSEEINIWLAYLPILPNPFLQLWKKYLPNFCYVSPLFAFLPLSCSESVKYFYAEASPINSFFLFVTKSEMILIPNEFLFLLRLCPECIRVSKMWLSQNYLLFRPIFIVWGGWWINLGVVKWDAVLLLQARRHCVCDGHLSTAKFWPRLLISVVFDCSVSAKAK